MTSWEDFESGLRFRHPEWFETCQDLKSRASVAEDRGTGGPAPNRQIQGLSVDSKKVVQDDSIGSNVYGPDGQDFEGDFEMAEVADLFTNVEVLDDHID